MPQFKTSKDTFMGCERDGFLVKQEEIDRAKIKHMLAIALADFEAAKSLIQGITKQSLQWSTIYKLCYDALHQLAEAFMHFDCIKSNNHQCLFAYLCEKHPELEFDWRFLEKIRTKRNGIQYYGEPAAYADWKSIELQLNIYNNTLKKAIEEKLK